MIRRAARPQQNFVIISNTLAQDARLSYRARGLLLSILSRPDGWSTDSASLARASKEGRDAVRSTLTELEEVGYIVRGRAKNNRGQWVYEMTVYDTAEGNPAPGNPALESQAINTKTIEKEKDLTAVADEPLFETQSEPKAQPKEQAIEQQVTVAAYEKVKHGFAFLPVRAMVKWAIHDRGAEPRRVEAALVGLYDTGKPITKMTLAQWLDGKIAGAPQAPSVDTDWMNR